MSRQDPNLSHSARVYRLNAICPYFTMFPLRFPMDIMGSRRTKPTWVLDPFCGRGTTGLAARIQGIPSVGFDVSPVAVAVAQSKGVAPTPEEIVSEARAIIARGSELPKQPLGEFWELAYHPSVLRTLCLLREDLMSQSLTSARFALRGIILGALHGPLSKRKASYFSNQAPRTFASKPTYSVRFWRNRGLCPPEVDVLEIIRVRSVRYYSERLPEVDYLVLQHDSRLPPPASLESWLAKHGECSLVITSPPYLGMRTYVSDQWLRNWFLGGPDVVDYDSTGQLGQSAVEKYVDDLKKVWVNVATCCSEEAEMVIRFGCLASLVIDAEDVIRRSLEGTPWRLTRTESAGDSRSGKRQADAFSCSKASPIEEIDVYCVRA